MRTVVVDGVAFEVPAFVVRVPHGWQVRVPGHTTRSFAASQYGGVQAALMAAKQHRATLVPDTVDAAPGCKAIERKDKVEPTGIPGVVLAVEPSRGKRTASVSLLLKVKWRAGERPMSRMYVGTINNYKSRLQGCIARAADMVQKHGTARC